MCILNTVDASMLRIDDNLDLKMIPKCSTKIRREVALITNINSRGRGTFFFFFLNLTYNINIIYKNKPNVRITCKFISNYSI